MTTFALLTGYAVIIAGGVSLVALLCALAMDYAWTVIKRTYDMERLGQAMRRYETEENENRDR